MSSTRSLLETRVTTSTTQALVGTNEDETIIGSRGATLLNDDTPVVIYGSSYGDDLFGGNGDDTIHGGGAGDWLVGKGGDDEIYGGSGNDVIFGGGDDDHLYGGSGADAIYGGAGSDSLYGGSGDDDLYGGSGDDVFLLGGGSVQHVFGGAGRDTVNLINLAGTKGMIVNLQAGLGIVPGTGNFGLEGAKLVFLDGVERVVGSIGDDTITGDGQNNDLMGFSGDDTLYGGGGADILQGGGDHDTLFGGDGADTLEGNSGNDTLDGGAGDDDLVFGAGLDTLTGGAGSDTFIFAADYAYNQAQQVAHITDFDDDFDKIDLQNLGLDGIPLEVIYSQNFAANGTGEIQILNNGSSSTVNIDVDGNGVIDLVIEVDHPAVQFLAAEDFYL